MQDLIIVDDYLLKELVEKYINDIINNLIDHDKVASGYLINHINYIINDGKAAVTYPAYLVNVDRGTKKGHYPPPSAIRKWIDDKRIEPYGDISKDQLAYAISKKILKKGIRATNVLRDANADFDIDLLKSGVFRNVKKIINGFKLDFGKGRVAGK